MTRGTIGFCLSRIIRGEKKKKNWESTLIIPHWVKYLRLDKSFYPRECANVLKQLEQDLRSMRSQPTEIGLASWGEIDAGLYKDHLGILDSSFSKINILFHFGGMGGVGWFPVCSDGKKICLQLRRPGFDPWVRKIPWRREWLPTPVFLSEESLGQRSLADYSPWGHKELDMT